MAKKEITSRPGLFGTTNHYDSRGRKVGESRPGLFGTVNHYDAKGKKSAEVIPDFLEVRRPNGISNPIRKYKDNGR